MDANRQKTGGRKKGVQNKLTRGVKEAIARAFDELGGTSYLVEVGRTDPKTFCTLLGKVLPAEIQAQAIKAASQNLAINIVQYDTATDDTDTISVEPERLPTPSLASPRERH